MASEIQTPLCRMLGIDYPIFNVGFANSAIPELAAAVSNAGGGGVLGTSSAPVAEIHRWITRTRELTSRPFGANFIIASQEHPEATEDTRKQTRARIAAAIEEQVSFLVLFWGNPAPFVDDAHSQGVKVFIQVGSVSEAEAAAAAGVDAVIIQGIEAGGHVKATRSIWENLPATVKAIDPLPVLASGGIGDGRAIARALRLGAQGVSLGTRFVASEEAWTDRIYKERVTQSRVEDTFYGDLFDVDWEGAPHRVIRNRTFDEWDAAGRPPVGRRPGQGTTIGTYRTPWGDELPWQRYAVRMIPPDFDGDIELAPMWAGESCSEVNNIKPAGDIVRDLAREAEAALAGDQAVVGRQPESR